MDYFLQSIKTPIGDLRVIVSEHAVCALLFPGGRWSGEHRDGSSHPVAMNAAAQLEEYFAGSRKVFDLPLELSGTPFQLSAWKVLRKIPYGKTINYGEEAKRAGNEKAVRAVGTANGKNPLPIFIPCHRVIAGSGEAGGYSGGSTRKKFLLQLEQEQLAHTHHDQQKK